MAKNITEWTNSSKLNTIWVNDNIKNTTQWLRSGAAGVPYLYDDISKPYDDMARAYDYLTSISNSLNNLVSTVWVSD